MLCSGVDRTTCIQIPSVTFNCNVTATTYYERPRFTNHSLAVLHCDVSRFSSVDTMGTRREVSTNTWWLIITCWASDHPVCVRHTTKLLTKMPATTLRERNGNGARNPYSGQSSQRNVHLSFMDFFNCTTPHNPSPFYPSMSCSQKGCCDKNANDHQIPSHLFAKKYTLRLHLWSLEVTKQAPFKAQDSWLEVVESQP